jgi:hypothetical protein
MPLLGFSPGTVPAARRPVIPEHGPPTRSRLSIPSMLAEPNRDEYGATFLPLDIMTTVCVNRGHHDVRMLGASCLKSSR